VRAAVLVVALLGLTVAAYARESAPTARPPDAGRPVEVEPEAPQAPEAPTGRLVIAAAGDIACEAPPNGPRVPWSCQYDETAKLVTRRVDHVLLLGDNQYERGSYAAYRAYFHPTWGRALAKISPVPGNHEHGNDPSSRPRGYFRYFGDRARGPAGLGFYSFDLGACPGAPCWHVIALDSELCFGPGGCAAPGPDGPRGRGTRMYRWLRSDLRDHPDVAYPCTLAFWHHPRHSFSTGSGATGAVQPLWDLLYAAGADVVLNGHSHNYQRWEPQDPAGRIDPARGITQFVVGTGGRSRYAIQSGPRPANLAAAQDDSFGVLRLTLRAEGYRWAWATAPGQPAFEDRSDGLVSCVRGDA
jgi:hypothetical protein